MKAPTTLEDWIALALKQGVISGRDKLPYASHGSVTSPRELLEWLKSHCVLPYDAGFDHGALQWPIADSDRRDAEFMDGYQDGQYEWEAYESITKGTGERWTELAASGQLMSAAQSPGYCSARGVGSSTVDWGSLARLGLQACGLLALLSFAWRVFAPCGGGRYYDD